MLAQPSTPAPARPSRRLAWRPVRRVTVGHGRGGYADGGGCAVIIRSDRHGSPTAATVR